MYLRQKMQIKVIKPIIVSMYLNGFSSFLKNNNFLLLTATHYLYLHVLFPSKERSLKLSRIKLRKQTRLSGNQGRTDKDKKDITDIFNIKGDSFYPNLASSEWRRAIGKQPFTKTDYRKTASQYKTLLHG